MQAKISRRGDLVVSGLQIDGPRVPINIACVIDTSGSMAQEATIKDKIGCVEVSGLTYLDVVKHGVRTIIAMLGDHDSFSLVAFASEVTPVMKPTKMIAAEKEKALACLDDLCAYGDTNLYGGIHKALELLNACEKDHAPGVILVLTDGMPNIGIPPLGYVKTLHNYFNANLRLPINTIGFGYNLDSLLLDEIATEFHGVFNFISDPGMIGTVLINTLARLLSTQATHAKVIISSAGPVSVHGTQTFAVRPYGYEVALGDMLAGHSRHVVARIDLSFPTPTVSVVYTTVQGKFHAVVPVYENADPEEYIRECYRVRFVELISGIQSTLDLIELAAEIKDSICTIPDPYLVDLIAEIEGQVAKACVPHAFQSWGRHYLRSLAHAHNKEFCLNFKDPAMQRYAGHLFEEIRDMGDDVFLKIPPPTPTCQSSIFGYAGYNMPAVAACIAMTSFHNPSGGCIHQDAQVLMLNGTEKRIADVIAGDILAAGQRVICVVAISNGDLHKREMVYVNKLAITPYHPVSLDGHTWHYPITLGPVIAIWSTAVYSLLLDAPTFQVDNVFAVGLAHRMDGLCAHPFFGTAKVVEDLKRCVGFSTGRIDLPMNCFVRDLEGVIGIHSTLFD
jgi:hypothetical protein